MSKKVNVLYLLVILALILVACQTQPATPEPVVETVIVTQEVEATPVETIHVVTPTPEPDGPRTLVICMGFGPETLYPYSGSSGLTQILQAISEGNYSAFDANSYAYQPVILEKLPSLADGDAALQGEPLTAADSVYAFNLEVEGTITGRYEFERTATYEAIDDLTTVWTGLPGFLYEFFYISFFGPAPEHAWSQYTREELLEVEEASLKPLGWGPYVIDEWVPGESLTLHKNPNYFRADEGLPKFDTLIFRFVGDDANASIAALLSGECDILDQTAVFEDQAGLLLDLQAEGQLKASFTTGAIWEQISFGIQHVDYDDGYQLGGDRPDFFSDVRTRQAFAMCMDRQAIVDEVLLGQSIVIDGYWPPQHPLYNPDVQHYDFDVLAGSALLEEVGWVDEDGDPGTPRIAQGVVNVPDGTSLKVSYETTNAPIRQQIGPMIKDSLAQCGIRINIQYKSPTDFFADGPEGPIYGRHFDLGQFAWTTGVFSPCFLFVARFIPGPLGEPWVSVQDGLERTFGDFGWEAANATGFASEEYDTACKTVYYSVPGLPEYETAHNEAQRIFAEQLPVVPLFLRIKLAATRPDMCGFIMDPTNFSEMWNIEEFDYGEGCEE